MGFTEQHAWLPHPTCPEQGMKSSKSSTAVIATRALWGLPVLAHLRMMLFDCKCVGSIYEAL